MQSVKSKKNKKGIVSIVGAGPGDPGLLTLRGAALLAQSDVVIYDGLVNPELLDLAPKAEKIYAGKIKELPRHIWSESLPKSRKLDKQSCVHLKNRIGMEEINNLMVQHASAGKRVVRLKGGDPFIFGRGGEEVSHLKKHGIDYEIVSGVSAGYSAPAYAGIPVTDRRLSSHVTFVTAHEDPKKRQSSIDWKKLAKLDGTLVSFMGVQSLPAMIQGLIAGGKSSETLVSMIQWGTLRRQQVIEGTLRNIVQNVQEEKMGSPAVAVIGEVNRFRKEFAWFEKTSAKRNLSELLSELKLSFSAKSASRQSKMKKRLPMVAAKKVLV